MSQSDLHRAVARVLGESVEFVAHRGFGIRAPLPLEPDPEDRIVDWDRAELERNVAIVEQKQFRNAA